VGVREERGAAGPGHALPLALPHTVPLTLPPSLLATGVLFPTPLVHPFKTLRLFFFSWGGWVQALVVSCCGCFHGRTMAAISMSCDNAATRGFGPLLPGQIKVDFGDIMALEKAFEGGAYAIFFSLLPVHKGPGQKKGRPARLPQLLHRARCLPPGPHGALLGHTAVG